MVSLWEYVLPGTSKPIYWNFFEGLFHINNLIFIVLIIFFSSESSMSIFKNRWATYLNFRWLIRVLKLIVPEVTLFEHSRRFISNFFALGEPVLLRFCLIPLRFSTFGYQLHESSERALILGLSYGSLQFTWEHRRWTDALFFYYWNAVLISRLVRMRYAPIETDLIIRLAECIPCCPMSATKGPVICIQRLLQLRYLFFIHNFFFRFSVSLQNVC